jgi:hypothetical protein
MKPHTALARCCLALQSCALAAMTNTTRPQARAGLLIGFTVLIERLALLLGRPPRTA